MTGAPHPHGSGDGWVQLPDGRRFWGLAGAAGLLAVSPTGSVLLQHRVAWSHFGDTWGLPGGARALGESARDGAFREAREETAIDTAALTPRFESVFDLGVWSYTTVAASAAAELPVRVSDAESNALAWVPAECVTDRPLHPGFGESWPLLRARFSAHPALVVDVANTVGATPDGWWRDRQGAAERLVLALSALAGDGIEAPQADAPVTRWWPEIVAVVEGAARAAAPAPGVELARADASGDDRIVAEARSRTGTGRTVTVITADRELRRRVEAVGASVHGPRWLLDRLS